jgi:hypothetical protein
MYKILYLPKAEFVFDGDSTERNSKLLTFKTKKEAKFFIKTHDFRLSDSDNEWCKGWIYDRKPSHTLPDPIIPKHFLEPVKV